VKRILCALLCCLLLCGFVTPAVFADDENTPIIWPEDGQPLALDETAVAEAGDIFTYTPEETGWVHFTISETASIIIWFYEDANRVWGIHASDCVTSFTLKALKDWAYCFEVFPETDSATINLSIGEAPVLKQEVLKGQSGLPGKLGPYQPYQRADWYVGVDCAINGKSPEEYGISSPWGTKPQINGINNVTMKPGVYELRFYAHGDEDLGTLTIILEKQNLCNWLKGFLSELVMDFIGLIKSIFN